MELVIVDRTHAARWLYSKSRGHLVRYLISIGKLGEHKQRLPSGYHRTGATKIRLEFDDIEGEKEYSGGWGLPGAVYYGPTLEDMRRLVGFCNLVNLDQDGYVVSHCYAGVSRSTAAAYILYASQWGPDRAPEAAAYVFAQQLKHKTRNQSPADPNYRMVRLASEIVGWDMETPLSDYEDEFWRIRNAS